MKVSIRARLVLGVSLCLAPGLALAQGEIVGRVLTGAPREPVALVQITIAGLGRSAVSDSLGRFRLTNLPPGDHRLALRALGFRPDSALVGIDGDEVAVLDFVLTRQAQALPEQRISGVETFNKGKLAGFLDRKKAGIGHFLTRDDLQKAEGGMMQTGNVLSKVPGVDVVRANNFAWISSGRAVSGGGCAFCRVTPLNKYDRERGAKNACYMDVYLDGALVFDSKHPDSGLFDVNSIQPSNIEGVEVYTSAAQVPVQYNKTGAGCGVLLIWTR